MGSVREDVSVSLAQLVCGVILPKSYKSSCFPLLIVPVTGENGGVSLGCSCSCTVCRVR
jgi:hypothetical protein